MINGISTLKKPVSFFWEPTELCNLHCKHCYTNSGPNNKLDLTFEKSKNIIDMMYDEGVYSVGIGGGEPLMIPFLKELIEYINFKKMNVSISTNGLLLTRERLMELKEAGLKIIQVSIDGIKEDHEFLRGEGTYNSLIETIQLIQSFDIGVRVGSTINSRNYKNIHKFIDEMKANGVGVINFFRYMPFNQKSDFLELSDNQLKHATYYLVEKNKENVYVGTETQEKFYITFEPLSFFAFLYDERFLKFTECTAGRAKFNLSSSGDVSLCNYIPNSVGNINNENIEYIWEKIKKESKDIILIPIECEDCQYSNMCKGGCKGFSYIKGKNYITKDNACFKHLLSKRSE